ncbi:hypothetical protein COU17_00915 [Candidatus Kaiserbacteria bacterium CG10_big_fil_rev_8_21_14_0_10_49_17]|uniref:RecF/RecN/SMC N-terminal domain-containing protein n=1 Tax=Candidatus Kaiserbacteria bacterium CG10_big_fil_rev_8_21_14_0_10_49_17 TaxID=1974609 RepID=A0A2M6WEY4_9BACT|nr:MAG: hypothetical protein COU17_00915 [Candidatus Kaiserbacteria bacterium CG10_big_fil_rev_8_21_14_0_10_49_17]
MYLKSIELSGFKSFAKKGELEFSAPITAVVGPNGSGKSNVAEGFRFVLGEQSMKSMRSKRGEDLIWGGSHSIARMNRGSVKVVFDNTKRLLDVDFDEVSIERIVHRDGGNEYRINGSPVRLKDVVELLAGAHIGASGHHIISQGEADKILNANLRERREAVEDALGLTVYHYKLAQSERKLERTNENISQVQSLRREIAPHIKFLSNQVKKLEKAREMREELKGKLREYLKREEIFLTLFEKRIKTEKNEPVNELASLTRELSTARRVLESSSGEDEKSKEVLSIERALSEVRNSRDALSRELGRIEGQLSFAKRHAEKVAISAVPFSELESFMESVSAELSEAQSATEITTVRSLLVRIKERVAAFLSERRSGGAGVEGDTEVAALQEEKSAIEEKLESLSKKEGELSKTYSELKEEIEAGKDEERVAEREVFRITTRKQEVESVLRDLERQESELTRLVDEFKRDREEGVVLVGRDILSYTDEHISNESVEAEDRHIQEERRRDIERLKIRLEEYCSGSGEDVMKEYEEATERDAFLVREIEDLEKSAESLQELITTLTDELETQFKDGIAKINSEFQHFFEILFGGGTASLSVVRATPKRRRSDAAILEEVPEEESETGIDISISLPRKKVKGLEMLSGGERALTSIALLFAMSQVNPPPFLILDETDAALDEANSRKYGQMIRELAKKTQLILITHNRETMSTAGVLYGVTMGADGVSKLLSVKFEEAVKVAK